MNEIITQEAAKFLTARTDEEVTASLMANMRMTALGYIGMGADLLDMKARLGHGKWLPYLKQVGISSHSAENYMRMAMEIPTDSPMAQLPYSKALALLEAPEDTRAQLMADGVEDKSAAEIRRLTKELEATRTQMFDWQKRSSDNAAKLRASEDRREALEKRLDDEIALQREVIIEKAPDDYEATKKELARTQRLLMEANEAAEEAEEKAARAMSAAQKAGMLSADHSDVLDPGDVEIDRFEESCRNFVREWSAMPWLEELTVLPARDLERLIAMADMVDNLVNKISATCEVRRDRLINTAEGVILDG